MSLSPALPSDGPLVPASGATVRVIPTTRLAAGLPVAEEAAPPGLRATLTPGAVLAAIRRRWAMAVPVGLLLAALTATAVWSLRPDKYTAFAVLRVAASEQKILQEANRQQENSGYIRTQVALMRSRPVLRTALRDEKVRQLPVVQRQADPVEWLEKELAVEQIQNTELVRVSLTSRTGGGDLAPVVNAVIEAYMAEVVRGEHAQQEAHLSELQKVYSAVEDKIRLLRESFQGLTRDLKGGDAKILTLKQQTLLEEYSALKRELAIVNTRYRDLDLKIATYRLRLESPPTDGKGPTAKPAVAAALDALVERELEADPRVAAAATEAAKVREQLRQFDLVSADPKSGYRAEIQKRLDAAEAAVTATREERRTVVAARQQTLTEAGARQQILEAEAERGVLQKQQGVLQNEATALKRELDSLGINSVELELKRGEIERSEQFLRTVWDQKERLEVELKGAARHRVAVVSTADDATVLNKAGRVQEAGGAGFGGLLLGLLAVGVLDLRRNRIHTPTDVSRGLRLRVIGALPKLPAGTRSPVPLADKYGRGSNESVDGLRTSLLTGLPTAEDGGGSIFLVASAVSGEGKTTLANQLAASFARARRRTLLIDCDLRSPSLHRMFGLEASPGMCEALTGTVRAADVARPTNIDGLHVLAAGRLSPEGEAGLAQPAVVRRILDELRGRYDVIVIDSSPVLLVPDALMVAGSVDGLILSVRPGVSQAADVYAGYVRLSEHHLPILGVVVNGVVASQSYARGYGPPSPTVKAG